MCCILLRTVMAKYKATYQIGTKSTTSQARKRKEQRKKVGKTKLAACENRRKKACLIFRSLGGAPLAGVFAPDIFGISQLETVDCETLHLFSSKTDNACLHDLCRGNCFAREAQEIVLYFCTWRWMNIWQYLRTNHLLRIVTDVAASYVFSWIWPCNGY